MGIKSIYSISKHRNLKMSFLEMCLTRPDFERAVQALHDKHEIYPDDFTDEKIRNDEAVFNDWIRLQEDTELGNDVENMLSQFGLPKSWHEIALLYVIDGGESEVDIMHNNSNGLIIEKTTDDNEVILKIGPDTTYEDYKLAWQRVQEIRGTKNQHIRKRDNVLRDTEIFMLHKHGMFLPEICVRIDKRYPSANEDGISETNVRKIINDVYDRNGVPEQDRTKIV